MLRLPPSKVSEKGRSHLTALEGFEVEPKRDLVKKALWSASVTHCEMQCMDPMEWILSCKGGVCVCARAYE